MTMLAGDYTHRIQTAQKGALVGAGYANSPVHVAGDGAPHEVVQAGGVVTVMSISATSSGTNMYFKDSNGTIQDIITGATVARDYRLHFYAPWPVYVVSDVDLVVVVCPPAKGVTIA